MNSDKKIFVHPFYSVVIIFSRLWKTIYSDTAQHSVQGATAAAAAEHCISIPMLKNFANLSQIIDFSAANFPPVVAEFQVLSGGHTADDFFSIRDLEFGNSARQP
jgi:hypothetical protein